MEWMASRVWQAPRHGLMPWFLMILGGLLMLEYFLAEEIDLIVICAFLVGSATMVVAIADLMPTHRWRLAGTLRIIGLATGLLVATVGLTGLVTQSA